MNQQDVLDYVLLAEHNCEVYKTYQKEAGVFYMLRKKGTSQMVVVYPVKNKQYTPAAVCHICNQLIIEVPEYGRHMQPLLDKAKETVSKTSKDNTL